LDEWSKKFKNKDVDVAVASSASAAMESGNGVMDTSSDDKIDEGKKRKSKDISTTTSDSQQEMDNGDNSKESRLKNPAETNTDSSSDMSISSVDNSPRKEMRKEDEPQKLGAAGQEKGLSANSTTDNRREGRSENEKEVHGRVPRKPGIVQRVVLPADPAAAASRKRPPEELAANLSPQKKATLASSRAVDPKSQQGPQEQQPNKGGMGSNDKASPFAKELNAFTKQVEAAKTNEPSADDQIHCKVCNVTCSSEQQLLDHCNGEKHRQLNGIVVQVNAPDQVDATPHNKDHKIDRPDETLYRRGVSIFIRNAPDNTSEEDIRALFEPHALKVNNKILGVTLNLVEGFCFIAFDGTNAVHAIISQAQKVKSTFKIHGCTLEVHRNVFNYFCKVCNVPCVNELNFRQHVRGKKHQDMKKNVEGTPSNKKDSPQQNQATSLNQGANQQTPSQQKETSTLAPKAAATLPEATTQDVSSNQSTSLVGGTKVSGKDDNSNVSSAAVEKNKQQPVATSTQSTQVPSKQQQSKALDTSTASTPSNSSSKDNTTWRRRVIRKCTVDNCPNKGGKCDQHGPMVKTCSVPDCMKVPQHGGLCASHGGKRDVNKAKKPDATTAMKTTPKKTDTPVDNAGTPTTATINTKTADASVTNAKAKANASSTANTEAAAKTVTTQNTLTVSSSQGNTSPVPNNTNNNVLDNSNARDVYEKVAAKAKARRESAESGHQNVALAASNAEEGKEPEMNDDVIDLTEDSSSHESTSDVETHPASVIASTLNRNQAIKEDEVRSRNSPPPPPPPPPPPSPPASPIPPPIIHDLPPPSMPQPKPFMDNRKVVFLADRNPVFTSGNLQQRNSCTVEYDTGCHLDGSGSCCYDAHYIDASERLKTWDPYWKVVEVRN